MPEKGKEESVEEGIRFPRLYEIDKAIESQGKESFEDDITLKEFCEGFRAYCASKLSLYYTIEEIRRFVAGLSSSKIILMQGMSGTGKTSLAVAFGKYVKNPSAVIPIQPMWKERTDLLGYYNEFTKKFNETELLCKMYEANAKGGMYITVLDEMNIARIEYYFAEFLSLLELPENSGRYLDVVGEKWESDPKGLENGKIKLPENMWFVGTANNDDSTFVISDKVYDRAMVMDLNTKCKPFEARGGREIKLSAEKFRKLCENAREEYGITERNLRRIKVIDEYLQEKYHTSFGNRIMKQIKEYVPVMMACGGSEEEGIDDILSRKVLRKLESQNPVYVKDTVSELKALIEKVFGKGNMKGCDSYLDRLERVM